MNESTQSGLDRDLSNAAPSEAPSGPDCVDNSFGRREGFSVGSGQPWFKHWGKESIASGDLNSLTDHEERVWWRLLAVACTEPERWRVRIPTEGLARMCASTPAKLKQCIWTFEKRGMVVVEEDGTLFLPNAERYQETPEARRQRNKRDRDKGVTPSVTSHENVTPKVTVEERREKRDLSEPKGSSSEGAQKRTSPSPRKPKAVIEPLSDEQLATLVQDFPDFDVAFELENCRNITTWATTYRSEFLALRARLRMKRADGKGKASGAVGVRPVPQAPFLLRSARELYPNTAEQDPNAW